MKIKNTKFCDIDMENIDEQMRKDMTIYRRTIVAIKVIVLIAVLMIGGIIISSLFAKNRHYMPYLIVNNPELLATISLPITEMDNMTIKNKVDSLFGNPFYWYMERNVANMGTTVIEPRIINMQPNLTQVLYAYALAHELTHLTNYTTNERYCNFNAFKVLYESDEPFFVETAKWWGNYWLHNNSETDEYSCGGYIENYLLMNAVE